MTMQRLALAALAAVAMTGPAWAATSIPEGKAPGVTYVLDKGVTSNRLATARMWTSMYDTAQALRADVAAERYDEALTKVREVRARIEQMQASKVVDQPARLLVNELRPFAVSLEQDIAAGRTRNLLRGVDTMIGHLNRTQNELIAAGHMERMGGGAGAWRLPKMPEVKIYPPGTGAEVVPAAPPPKTEVAPGDAPMDDPNRSVTPGNERNRIDENRPEEE
jgi:hypothetical protein